MCIHGESVALVGHVPRDSKSLEAEPASGSISVAIQVEDEEDAVLHVGNLDRRVTESQLHSALQGVVKTLRVTIPKGSDSMSAGYAIVQFASARAAKEAIATCAKLQLCGRRTIMWVKSSVLCPVGYASNAKLNARSKHVHLLVYSLTAQAAYLSGSDTLLFDNLTFSTTEAMLYKLVSRVGTVQSIRVVRDEETSKSLGYAYVQMSSPQEAARTLNIFRDSVIDSQRSAKNNTAETHCMNASCSTHSVALTLTKQWHNKHLFVGGYVATQAGWSHDACHQSRCTCVKVHSEP
ncbi:nucleolin-like [Cyclospora cayetanensis]|uniref:Nucleolin-like n=1 Tax=Cyclospora cayetanensis TaxID=88456 RepID=A0A6P6S133_9EIME|nr:nucleolin-like [Cyclospora cayetanensis]